MPCHLPGLIRYSALVRSARNNLSWSIDLLGGGAVISRWAGHGLRPRQINVVIGFLAAALFPRRQLSCSSAHFIPLFPTPKGAAH
jgi:hypothetical protein